MQFKKIRISQEATMKLRYLKSKTGLTPNILCRLGLTLSLSELQPPDPALYKEDGMEFNRYTLFGEWDRTFVALLIQHSLHNQKPADTPVNTELVRAHLCRGTAILGNHIRSLTDLCTLLGDEPACQE